MIACRLYIAKKKNYIFNKKLGVWPQVNKKIKIYFSIWHIYCKFNQLNPRLHESYIANKKDLKMTQNHRISL